MQHKPQFLEELLQQITAKAPKGMPGTERTATAALNFTGDAIRETYVTGPHAIPGDEVETQSTPIVNLAAKFLRLYYEPWYAQTGLNPPNIAAFSNALSQGLDWPTITRGRARGGGGTGGT